jgi:hypothetical protein
MSAATNPTGGKDRRRYLVVGQAGSLRRVGNPPGAGSQPARSLPSCPTNEHVHAVWVLAGSEKKK